MALQEFPVKTVWMRHIRVLWLGNNQFGVMSFGEMPQCRPNLGCGVADFKMIQLEMGAIFDDVAVVVVAVVAVVVVVVVRPLPILMNRSDFD